MRARQIRLVAIGIIIVAGVVIFWVSRVLGQAETFPPIALCPGPDEYGYTCEPGAAFPYLDATIDSLLYEDDGVTILDLPFAFVFYGTTYTQVAASSNGNLQFTTQTPAFDNLCLNEAAAPEMGDMIAPYWDDLNLTAVGFLRYDTFGESPERIFVIEWEDVPRFDSPEDLVTFEVQLFEGSNDIVFVYRTVSTTVNDRGSGATIGLQSEGQGRALQYGCNQLVLNNNSAIHFPHPSDGEAEDSAQPAGPDLSAGLQPDPAAGPVVKGDVALLLDSLAGRGQEALPQLRQYWLSQSPQRDSQWAWADLTGDGRQELVFLWRGPAATPTLTQLVILATDNQAQLRLAYQLYPLARQEEMRQLELWSATDVTGDGAADVILRDPAGGRLVIVSAASGQWTRYTIAELCSGHLGLRDVNGDGTPDVIRDGCQKSPRVITSWNGHNFVSR
ncbi:MAG: VCBS repeat-containing protein [Chloroflexi bacterium]|nr:VCBS repeat-containing protein [Chloroflexota bacterium]MCI0577551.1 VCBS repeat-containing protein [Chloroflexota bacterium]MCI0645610.1 VCBS repeat-containing protein [Chloroflexota bacterium]MCI0725522.1 VCBS repeat-containing protein [Chloroflexota bacterium]